MRFPIALLAFPLAASAAASDCSVTSVGFTPLDELGAGTYLGFGGGLYAGGSNALPPGHEAAGLLEVAEVVPRDAAGNPDPAGKVVFVSIGMSNTALEFTTFVPLSVADPLRRPAVVPFNLAAGGVPAEAMDDPADPYWSGALADLAAASLSPAQVQVIWLLTANAMPTDPFPTHATSLQASLASIVAIARDVFPNARLCYVTSRIYAGYATTPLNPEPYAYESGFAVKWLIEQQIGGDPALAFTGAVEAPWLAWARYNWGDGLVPRADGLVWECDDFAGDGTHPDLDARLKVASRLLEFLHTDSTCSWYRLPTVPVDPFCDGSDGALDVCPCGGGLLSSGCDLPQQTGGVRLTVLAQAHQPNAATLCGSGFPLAAATTAIVLRAGAPEPGGPVAFGDGVRCVGASSLVRLGAANASAGSSTHVIGHGPAAGTGTFHYQLWLRSQPASWCTSAAFNLSSGRRLDW